MQDTIYISEPILLNPQDTECIQFFAESLTMVLLVSVSAPMMNLIVVDFPGLFQNLRNLKNTSNING